MKKIIISAFCLCSIWASYSQIGIGATLPDKSAILDLESENKGLLIPRVDLVSLTEQVKFGNNLTESLLVYNTSTSNGLVKGFYYWKIGDIPADSKWIPLTDESTATFVEKLTELGLKEVKLDYPNVKGELVEIPTPVLTYKGEDNLTVEIPLYEALKKAETKTLLEKEMVTLHKYVRNYEESGVPVTVEGYTADKAKYESNIEYNFDGTTIETPGYTYYNESGDQVSFNGSDLVSPGSETLTSLDYQPTNNELIYKDELGQENVISLKSLVTGAETITKLELVSSGDSGIPGLVAPFLKYESEDKVAPYTYIPLKDLMLSAWNDVATKNVASSVDQYIYTNKWVGIGFDAASPAASATNEKLRVNGSITATDSYYADYVFEDYFEGSSTIKEAYSFKSLDEVENFISVNRHLPGITPISELEKTDTGYSFNVSELSIQLLEKTEELYLHILEQNKQLKVKEEQLQTMNQLILDLQKSLLEVKEQLKGFNK